MTEMTLVGCTNTKRDQKIPASAMYQPSTLYRKRLGVALQSDRWGILSAEYGFVQPWEIIEPYDTHIKDRDSEQWAAEVLDELLPVLERHGVCEVKILAGKRYVDPLTADLESEGYEVIDPLRGKMIGERMSRLDELAQQTEQTKLQGGQA